jgi:uncharacterized protein
MITVNSRKFDGIIRRTWRCDLLEQLGSLLVCVGEFEVEVEHPDLGRIRKGTLSYEYFWLDRWYNIFRFHEPSGDLRNFYCNVCMPPSFDGNSIDYVDLDIDVLVQPDLSYVILDREDYERSAQAFGYSVELNSRVEDTVNELVELIETRNLPGLQDIGATSV